MNETPWARKRTQKRTPAPPEQVAEYERAEQLFDVLRDNPFFVVESDGEGYLQAYVEKPKDIVEFAQEHDEDYEKRIRSMLLEGEALPDAQGYMRVPWADLHFIIRVAAQTIEELKENE